MKVIGAILLIALLNPILAQTHFEDITSKIGELTNIPDTPWGSGVSAADYDDDGDIDLFFTGDAGAPNLLIETQNNFWFIQKPFDFNWNTDASLWLDYNGDHRLDLFVAGYCPYGTSGCSTGSYWRLLEQQGNGTFLDVSKKAGLSQIPGLNIEDLGGLAAGDLNLDGYLDLVITYWKGPAIVYMNDGDWTFTNRSELLDTGSPAFYQSLIYDLDHDGRPEIYLTTDFMEPNQYWKQDGGFNFSEVASGYGLDNQCDDMGIALGDVENDGDLDLFISCIGLGTLLIDKGESYANEASEFGIGENGWAWGVTFFDANNDSFQDLAITNGPLGSGFTPGIGDTSQFWLNTGQMLFIDKSDVVKFNDGYGSSALISLDIDRDGDLDLVQTLKPGQDKAYRVLENKLEVYDKGNYLVIKPRMNGTNHWAIGSEVKIKYGDHVQVKPITAGISFYAQEPAEAFFGLGDVEEIDEIEITWPGGGKTIKTNIGVNQEITITDDDALHPPHLQNIGYETEGVLQLNWKNLCEGHTTTQIEFADNNLFANSTLLNVESTKSSALVENLEVDKEYFFRLRATRNEEKTITSNILSATSPTATLLAPTKVTAKMLPMNALQLDWMDNSTNEESYIVERSLTEDFEESLVFELEPNSSSLVMENLQPGFTYFFRVRSKSRDFYSNYSNVTSLTASYYILRIGEKQEIAIYPNPTENFFKIEGIENGSHIQIRSLSGKLMIETRYSEGLLYHDLPAGVYLISITDTKKEISYHKKLIVH